VTEIFALLASYYICAADAEVGRLTQPERFACNERYQTIKRSFLTEDVSVDSSGRLSPEQNTLAYRRFKAWEAENDALIRSLKQKRAKSFP